MPNNNLGTTMYPDTYFTINTLTNTGLNEAVAPPPISRATVLAATNLSNFTTLGTEAGVSFDRDTIPVDSVPFVDNSASVVYDEMQFVNNTEELSFIKKKLESIETMLETLLELAIKDNKEIL
jgi:hypothetical protein